MKPGFSAQILRKFKKTSSMKIPPVEAELFEADRQTDWQIVSQTDRQIVRQTDRQTDRQTYRQTRLS